MKKVYISLPITGRPIEEAKAEAERVKDALRDAGYQPVSPFDVVPEIPEHMTEREGYAYCMGKDIEALLLCDAIYLCGGHEASNGCRLERMAAMIYGKEFL